MNKQQFSPLKYILRKAAAPKNGAAVFFIRQKKNYFALCWPTQKIFRIQGHFVHSIGRSRCPSDGKGKSQPIPNERG